MEESFTLRKATKTELNFPNLDLSTTTSTLNENTNQPILIIQSPKTPTLSKKVKVVSLDSSEPKEKESIEVPRDVASMPNTPKKQQKSTSADDKLVCCQSASNLKKIVSSASNVSLKTLPEIMTLQDFTDCRPQRPVKMKAKGLLERRGSNASLTIDLGNNSRSTETTKVAPLKNFNNVKSVSHVNLSTVGMEKCSCELNKFNKKMNLSLGNVSGILNKSQTNVEEFDKKKGTAKLGVCKNRCYTFHKKCNCLCNFKCHRKSLSNENLYVPPCSFCQSRVKCGASLRHCKGCKRTVYPRQADVCQSQTLSDDFKLHLQNVQYLQNACNALSLNDLKVACELTRVPKLHQEFWEVPLNLQEKCIVSGSQNKNRYKGVLPNEHSRVHLNGENDYIHANYIKGPDYTESFYIATQGPMTHTCNDFWQMVWSNKSNCIVMLTNLVEKGRSKCELYFPLGRTSKNSNDKSFYYVKTTKVQDRFTFDFKNTRKYEDETIAYEEYDEITFDKFRIELIEKIDCGHYTIRQLKLKKIDDENEESRKVWHFWYPKWQDHKMANPQEVLQLALDVLARNSKIKSKKSENHDVNSLVLIDEENNQKIKSGWQKIQEEIKQNLLKKSQSALDYFVAGSKDNLTKLRSFNNVDEHVNNNKSNVMKFDGKNQMDIPSSPIIVHCSAGIGRTGCFLAVMNGIQQLKGSKMVDVLAILCSMRLNRGGMVQTAEQYELIHRVLNFYAESL